MAENHDGVWATHPELGRRFFERDAWDGMAQNRYGWKAESEAPPEVSAMMNKAEPDPNADVQQFEKATELAKKIYEAKTVDEVNKLVPDGETRKTVLSAREERIEQLNAQQQ